MPAMILTLLMAAVPDAAHQSGSAPPPFELPAPTGPHRVGTMTFRLTDDSRPETFAPGGGARQVVVHAWYPAAAPRGDVAPYLREGLAEVQTFATLLRAEKTAFDALANVRTHAVLDAAPIAGPKLPVLVFSHGYTGIPSAYTALLEDLASHGYAVLSVVHPYEATAAKLADGRVVTMLDRTGSMLQAVRDVLGEWAKEDETMAAVTSANDDSERVRLLRGYLSGLQRTHLALRRWVDDTKLVVDRLSNTASNTSEGRLAARLDVSRLGVFGHSMGGVTAGQFCADDRRCRAGLNLDGIPQYGTMIDAASTERPFLMVYSMRPGRLGASDAIYRRAASPYYRADVSDTKHLDFCDMAFWGGPLRERPVLGALAPARASEITRVLVRRFFDQELLGLRGAFTPGMALLREVVITRIGPPAR